MSDATTNAPRARVPASENPALAGLFTDSDELRRAYLANSRAFRTRRLAALAVLSLLLVIPLALIYANGWWDVAGGASVSTGWAWVVAGTIACSLGAVVIDMLYRKEV